MYFIIYISYNNLAIHVVIIYFYYMLKERKKPDNLRCIVSLYTLLHILIIQLKIKIVCLHDTFLELKNS